MPIAAISIKDNFMARCAPNEPLAIGRGQKFAAFLSDFPYARLHEIQDAEKGEHIDVILDLGAHISQEERFCRIDPSAILAGLAFSRLRSFGQVAQFEKLCDNMQAVLTVANLGVRRHSSKTEYR